MSLNMKNKKGGREEKEGESLKKSYKFDEKQKRSQNSTGKFFIFMQQYESPFIKRDNTYTHETARVLIFMEA